MKLPLIAASLLAVGVIGTLAVKSTSTTATLPAANQVVLDNNTLAGNITNSLKADDSAYTKTTKTVIKFSVNPKRVIYLNDQVSFATMKVAVDKLLELQKQSNNPI